MIVVIAYSGYLILLLVGHLAAGVRSQGKESAPQSKLITELVLGSLVSRFGLAVWKLGWFGLPLRLYFLFERVVVCGHCLVTLSITSY